MKYAVIRDGVTVCIGHCNGITAEGVSPTAVRKAFAEIADRIRHNNGLTYTKSFYGLCRGDVVKIWLPDAVHVLKVNRNEKYTDIGTESDPLAEIG